MSEWFVERNLASNKNSWARFLFFAGKNFADKESLLQSVLQLTSNQEHSPTHSANGNTISSEEGQWYIYFLSIIVNRALNSEVTAVY